MTYNINDGLMGIQWGRGEWGISRCQVITRLSLHLFVGRGGGGRVQNIIKLRTSEREIHLLPANENFPQI